MLSSNIANLKNSDSLRNKLLSNNGILSKNNIDENKKAYEKQPYNEYLNLNSLMNNQISLGEYTLSTTERTKFFKDENISNDNITDRNYSQLNLLPKKNKYNIDNTFLINLIFHKMNIKNYRNYIYYIQKTFNNKFGDYLKNIIKNKEINNFSNENYAYEISKLENLIARYSIIIFFLVRHQQINIAKRIFLLMIKENITYINFFEKNIFKELSNIKNKIKLKNVGYPKSILTLSKIYSIILKYSLLFNLTKNRSIYISRYLSLQKLNYNFFLLKNHSRDSFLITDFAIKYLYANCLFNTCYYSIMFYSSMIIPITFSELIFKLYEGMNELLFEKKEKSLLLKASFNYALFTYINGNNDQALGLLELIKGKIIEYYEYNSNDDEDEEGEEDDIDNNNQVNDVSEEEINPIEVFNKRKDNNKKTVSFEQKLLVKRQETMRKLERKRGLSKTQNTIDKIKEILFNRRIGISPRYNSKNIFDPFHQCQYKKFGDNIRKKTCKIDDIKKFFISDVKTILNKKNRKCSITEADIKNKLKFQNNFGVPNKNNMNNSTQSIVDLRASHINFRSLFKINKINIPKYMTNSLLIETELLMCEIELDSKNLHEAYEHFKNSVLVLFISKQNDSQNDIKSTKDFRNKLRIISIYLKEINKFIEQKSVKNKFQVLKNTIKTTKTFLSLTKKNTFKDKKLELKKSSLRPGKNYLLETIEFNADNNIDKKGEEYYNNLINKKMSIEIEKFFLFLNTLSIYQIKLLNDTQPKREIRNDLPILFGGHFKDSLTSGQINNLRNLHTMSITRNMILINPDKLILPSNIRFSTSKYSKKEFNKKSNDIQIKNSKKNDNRKINEKIISFSNSAEYSYFKNIIFSTVISKKLQNFLLENYSLVMKILKELDQKEIDDILKNPSILVSPIKEYKKRQSKLSGSNFFCKNYLVKIKDIKELKKIIAKLNNIRKEEDKEKSKEQSSKNTLIESDSDNNSINLSIINASFFNNK